MEFVTPIFAGYGQLMTYLAFMIFIKVDIVLSVPVLDAPCRSQHPHSPSTVVISTIQCIVSCVPNPKLNVHIGTIHTEGLPARAQTLLFLLRVSTP